MYGFSVKMYVQYIDERELVVWISTPLLVLRAGWYDFATRVAKPRVKAKSYHPNRKALLGQQEWLKIIQPRARINVLHSLIVLENHTTTGAIQKICMAPVVEKSYNHWFHTKNLYGTSGCMTAI